MVWMKLWGVDGVGANEQDQTEATKTKETDLPNTVRWSAQGTAGVRPLRVPPQQ